MLLNSISALTAFPSEVLLIDINSIEPSLLNSRVGVNFIDSYYDYDHKLKWDNYPLLMAADETSSFFMPSSEMNIPASFPVLYTVSAFSDHLHLSFLGGASAIDIYPSRPYPIITKLSDNQISISAGFLSAVAFSEETSTIDFRKQVQASDIKPLLIGSAILDGAYKTSIKKGITIANLANDVGTKLANATAHLRLTPPRTALGSNINTAAERIIRESFMTEVTVNTPVIEENTEFGALYRMYWDNTQISSGVASINRLLSPTVIYSDIDGHLIDLNPDIKPGYSPNTPGAGFKGDAAIRVQPRGRQSMAAPVYGEDLTIEFNSYLITTPVSSIYLPQFSDITVWYETSAATFLSEVSSVALNTNYYAFSSDRPPYLNGYKFSINTPEGIQPAFTVNYQPSAAIYADEISSIGVQTSMVDNYYQSTFSIDPTDDGLISRFTNISDASLSAINRDSNITYLQNSWFPTSAVVWFENNGEARNYSITFETSSIYDSYFIQDEVEVIINRDKAIVTLTQFNITDNSVDIQASIFPEYDPVHDIIWSVFPPENVVIRDLNDPTIIIPQNTPVDGNNISVTIENLGVDNTTISLFTTQYNISGSTTWLPSNEIWPSVSLKLFGEVDDVNPINTGTLSAMFIRNGFAYRTPIQANIKWEETRDNLLGSVEFISQSGVPILENVVYPSTNDNSLIYGLFETERVATFPQNVDFRIDCAVFNPFYNYQAGKTFALRQYPLNTNLFATVSSDITPEIFSTEIYSSIIFSQSSNVVLSADIQNLNISEYDIIWNLDNTTLTGLTAEFKIDAEEICVGLSAFNALPLGNGFGRYNFFDNVCFFISTGIEPLDYLSFPEYNYLPNQLLTFNNFSSNFIALTSYSNCDSENIFLSANPFFDEYDWRIGNLLTTTLDNTAKIAVFAHNISADNTISVSAYNRYFPRDNPASIYNSISSTGTGFKQNVDFVTFPNIQVTLDIDNQLVDMRDTLSRAITFDINTSILDLSYGSLNLTLSSVEGIFREPIILTENITSLERIFSYDTLGLFTIPENYSQTYNVFLEGTVWKTINGFDFCAEQQTLTSNIVTLSAFDGPDVDIWTDHNVLSANEVATIINTTHDTIFSPFTSFSFWNGYDIQTGNLNTTFSATYASDGTYDVSLSGFRSDGTVSIKEWESFFIIDSSEDYDDNVNRSMETDIELPYALDETLIPSNAWQFSSTLNTAFNKLDRNINFLNEQCFIVTDEIPTYNIATYGLRNGVSKWRYQPDLTNVETTLDDYRDIIFIDDHALLINGRTIEIRTNDNILNLQNTITKITDIEDFKNPIKISYIDDKILILDQGSNNIYVTTFDSSNATLTLTHYWGGIGDKNSRTKLNNPTDMFTTDEFIFIVDYDSSNIKVYNKHLNWINNILLSTRPVAITGFENILFVLDEFGTVFELNDFIQVSSFSAVIGKNITYDPNNSKLYIVTDDLISVFFRNGTFVNDIHNISTNAKRIHIEDDELIIIYTDKLIKIFDTLSYQKITTLTAFSDDSKTFIVDRNEPVTSFVINDSLNKLKVKLSTLADSLTGKFAKYFSKDDVFLYSEIVSDQYSLSCLEATLGINEIVSYETINREIQNTYDCIVSLADYVNGDTIYPTQPPIWTWEYHRVDSDQRPNLEKTPLSWDELVVSNPPYSGVTWNSIVSSTGYENAFPVEWTWEDLTSGCVNAITWEEMEEGRIRAYTWEQLEQDDSFGNPFFLFEPCVN